MNELSDADRENGKLACDELLRIFNTIHRLDTQDIWMSRDLRATLYIRFAAKQENQANTRRIIRVINLAVRQL